MKRRLRPLQLYLVIAGVTFIPFFAQHSFGQSVAMPVADDQVCSSLPECVEEYQRLLPELKRNFESFSERFKEDLPEIRKDLKGFGDEGEEQLRQWIDGLRRNIPPNAPEPLPETTWI